MIDEGVEGAEWMKNDVRAEALKDNEVIFIYVFQLGQPVFRLV